MDYQRTTFSEIKHLLPPDTWAAWRNELNKGEFETESVLVFDGATTLAELNLDTPFAETTPVFLILVKGDLTVEKCIYNEDTDGATGLVVLGNLHAGTMLVGGQEIYVTGNLVVEELFWGDYNHGTLRVLGNGTIAVFAAVDYDAAIKGETVIATNLTPEEGNTNWQGLDIALVREALAEKFLLLEEIVVDDDSGETDVEVTLLRDEATEAHLRAGQSLLRS